MTGPRVVLPGKGGRIAGRYQLDELLGEGGIGVVYAGIDTRLGREVAVKVLRPHLSRRPDARARFVREARVASQLRHPNAVQVFDFGDDAGALFLVMERLIGTTTWHELHAPPAAMAIDRVIHVAYCVADVLAAAHDISLVHRDLKPDNIFIERAGETERVVVVDFGMAFIAAAQDLVTGRLTEEGLAGGTPEYMSPEQAADAEVGPAADIYSFGCVLFELCTGATPFRGNVPQLLSAHLYSPAPRLRALRPDAPGALDELCADMMSKRAVDRPTARAVRRRLAAMQQGSLSGIRRRLDPGVTAPGAAAMAPRPAAPPDAAGSGPAAAPPDTARPGVAAGSGVGASAGHDAGRGRIPSSPTTVDAAVPVVPIAVVGEAGAELLLALSASGLHPLVTAETIPPDAQAVLALGVDLEGVAQLIEHGRPVVADARPEDFGRITALLRAGVASIAASPLSAADVTHKLQRALAKVGVLAGEPGPRRGATAAGDGCFDDPGPPDDFGAP